VGGRRGKGEEAHTGPELSVVILSWNTEELLRRCLRALAEDGFPGEREILVVDNASRDGSAAMTAREFPRVRLLRQERNLGYAEGNNLGARAARGRWLCLLGSDTEVRPGALARLVDFLARHDEYGAAAPRLVSPDGETQRACMRFPGFFTALTFDNLFASSPPGRWVQDRYYMRDFDHLASRDVDQPPGTCLVTGRRLFLDLGGLDRELFLFFNDVDFCRRLRRRGAPIRYLAEAAVLHRGGASTGRYGRMAVQWQKDRLRYYRKWYGRWIGPLVKLFVLERGLEEWFAIRRRHVRPEERRAAGRELAAAVKEVLAS